MDMRKVDNGNGLGLIEQIMGKEILERFEIGGIKETKRGKTEDFENELVIDMREKMEMRPMHNEEHTGSGLAL